MADLLSPRCGCEDCQAAVSPGAYLASLLDYALKHVKNNGAAIDLAYLEKRFSQPFSALPMECEAMEKKVRQVRLAVEVLRDYLGKRPLLEVEHENALSSAEAEYRLAAYTRLLILLGATYEEVRRSRSASADERAALAERLGIELTPSGAAVRQDELDLLFLDPTLPVADRRALTEQTLEQLCGLADTTRDPLSEGVKYADDQDQITRWNFDGIYWDRNTDADGRVYINLLKIAANVFAVHVFADEARTIAIATGERNTAKGPVRLLSSNGSGLTGAVEIDYKADDSSINVSVVPSIVVWRLRRLRTLWHREDWPTTPAVADGQTFLVALIDPQVIGIGDLRAARAGDVAFNIWLARFNWLANQRLLLKTTREAAATEVAGLEAIVALALSTPANAVTVASLDTLHDAQAMGERIEQRLAALGLTSMAFAFLMPLVGLARNAQPIMDDEWETIYDTLLRARKQLQIPEWRNEEKTLNLTLSPSSFRVGESAAAPQEAINLSLPLWLSSRQNRRNWLEVLEARIAQETAVITAIADAVGTVEETTLPSLRDALVTAADSEGMSLVESAEWLTEELLIDFRMFGQQITTRVAQAIETIQGLIFGLRTGQLDQATGLILKPLESISALLQDDGRIDLFGRGEDDVLWHRVWNGRWRRWRSLGRLPGLEVSFRPSDVAVVYRDGGIDLLARGSNRVLWHKRYTDRWTDWLRVTDDLQLVGNVAVVRRGADGLAVFALRIGDLEVMRRDYDGTNWTAWAPTGVTSSRHPAAATHNGVRVDLILGRRAPDLFKPLHRWWDGAVWRDEPLDNVLFSDPAVTSTDEDLLDVFQNFSGHLLQKSWDGVAWNPWVDLDAAAPAGGLKLLAPPAIISSAPETITVFALRSGSAQSDVWQRRFAANVWSEWELIAADHLELQAADFETEWEWIGSYASFRAAMFVRLYPENLLQPSLIPRQTPAFRSLVEQSRPTKHLTPSRACELARKYSNYIRDVSSLEITATCQVMTDLNLKQPCKTVAPVRKNLLYLFGRTPGGKVYWCSVDPKDRSGYAQSFWEEVPLSSKDAKAGSRAVKLLGALPWLDTSVNQHHIYLFLDVDDSGVRKLKFMKFDLDRFNSDPWDSEPVELTVSDLPRNSWGLPPLAPVPTPNYLTIVPVQSDSVSQAPQLAIHQYASTFYAFIRPLNATGTGWAEGEWNKFQFEPRYNYPPSLVAERIDKLEAALRVNDVKWMVYRHQNSLRAYAAVLSWSGVAVLDYPSLFRGALPGSFIDSSIFLFSDEGGQMVYREIRKGPAPGGNFPITGPTFVTSLKLTTLARHSGSFQPTFFVAPAVPLVKGQHSYGYYCKPNGGELVSSSKFDVVPVMNLALDIPTGESVPALQSRRQNIKKVYEENKAASATIRFYLTEAYRLVPQQLGLNMQSSGEYLAALDWFTTVYDYRAPQAERYIDYGLAIDAGLPETTIYQHPEDWLLDPLNPHAIALTRRYAYTRFAITSLIRCLNEYGDSEFTNDTAESLVQARILYTTALELCDVPELRQQLGACAALIGALKIQPGTLVPPDVAAALGEIAEELTRGKVGGTAWGLEHISKMKALMESGQAWAVTLPQLTEMKDAALKKLPVATTAGATTLESAAMKSQAYSSLLTDPRIERAVKLAGDIAVSQASALMDKL